MERSLPPLASMPDLWVGVGCRRGTPMSMFEQALRMVCQNHGIAWSVIAGLATLDLKQTESGLLAFSIAQSWPLIYFSQTELENEVVLNPSGIVNAAVGVSSVCEAAALRAATQSGTLASMLLVPKQIFQGSLGLGAVTIAIATPQASAQSCIPYKTH
jgi:cobalamin biosynthesis protein CbiG